MSSEQETNYDGTGSKVERIAQQYAATYPWADGQALRFYFRMELANSALSEAATRVHNSILPGTRGWLVAILRALYVSPGHQLSHAEISNETQVPPANVTYQVDVLQGDGYVIRIPHESDRRITLVELTAKGKAVCERMLPARARFITDLGKVFTDEEKRLFNGLLERLQEAADSHALE